MKRLMLVFVVILLSIPAYAEVVYVRAGMAASDGSFVVPGGEKSLTLTPTIGMGSTFEWSGVKINVELQYTQKGVTSKRPVDDLTFAYYNDDEELVVVSFGDQELTYKYRYSYVEIPITVSFEPIPSLEVFGGVSLNLMVQSKLFIDGLPSEYDMLSEEYYGFTASEQKKNAETKKTEFSLVGGIKYWYNDFFVDLRYVQGLTSVVDQEYNKEENVLRYASFSIGVKI